MALFGMFDYKNPAKAAQPYLNKIPGELESYYNPYISYGQNAYPYLQNQYGNLSNNPGEVINNIGKNYQQSPGFNFALQQALQAGNHSAAAGGMVGSPQNQQQNMGIATNLANQDYNDYLRNALGMMQFGLGGEQNLFNTGYNASTGLADALASLYGNQAQLAYEGQNAENQHNGGLFGSIMGGLGSLGAFF